MNTNFEIGDLVKDGYNTEGIVTAKLEKIALAHDFAKDGYPLDSWLKQQQDPRLKDYIDDPWLDIIPLTGGAAYAPEALCTKIRAATKEDFDIAMKNAQGFGQETLKKIRPSLKIRYGDFMRYAKAHLRPSKMVIPGKREVENALMNLNQTSTLLTYTDSNKRFTIKYPKGWKIIADNKYGAEVIFVNPKADKVNESTSYSTNVNVGRMPLNERDLDAFVTEEILKNDSRETNEHDVSREPAMIDGMPALLITRSYTFQGEINVTNTTSVTKYKDEAYIVNASAVDIVYNNCKDLLKELILSIQFSNS